MKPVAHYRTGTRRPAPVTDFNYRPARLEELKTACASGPRRSFGAISRDYFNREARHDFVIEALSFAVMTALTVPMIVDCVRALAELPRALGM
jgi:hypothetical protein